MSESPVAKKTVVEPGNKEEYIAIIINYSLIIILPSIKYSHTNSGVSC